MLNLMPTVSSHQLYPCTQVQVYIGVVLFMSNSNEHRVANFNNINLKNAATFNNIAISYILSTELNQQSNFQLFELKTRNNQQSHYKFKSFSQDHFKFPYNSYNSRMRSGQDIILPIHLEFHK